MFNNHLKIASKNFMRMAILSFLIFFSVNGWTASAESSQNLIAELEAQAIKYHQIAARFEIDAIQSSSDDYIQKKRSEAEYYKKLAKEYMDMAKNYDCGGPSSSVRIGNE